MSMCEVVRVSSSHPSNRSAVATHTVVDGGIAVVLFTFNDSKCINIKQSESSSALQGCMS